MAMKDFGCWIDAAFNGCGWEEALDRTAKELGVRCLALIWGDRALAATSVSARAPAWFAGACRDILHDPGAGSLGEKVVDGAWKISWRKPIGGALYHAALFALTERPLDGAALETAAAVVRSAVAAHARVVDLATISQLKAAALDQSPWGAAIIDADLRVVEMNESCAAMLRRRDGVSLVVGRIVCRSREDQTALAQAVSATLRGPASDGGAVVRVSRPNSAQPYVMRLIGPRGPSPFAKCLLTLLDPNEEAHSAQEIWRAMFDLTDCELVVAEGLASGRRINDIAQQRGVSVETVRSQIKRLFERLNVTSQAQAAVLLSRVAPFRPAVQRSDPADAQQELASAS